MKKRIAAIISALLALSMISAAFASCTSGGITDDPKESDSESSVDPDDDNTESDDKNTDDESEKAPMIDCDNAPTIEYANSIMNGVNYYYPNHLRESAVIENMEMSLEYGLIKDGEKRVTALKNKSGASYVENTMDVFVRMNSGDTYYASASKSSTTSNLFRLGYYFYEARYEGQDFLNNAKVTETKAIRLDRGVNKANDVSVVSNGEDGLTIKLDSDQAGNFDPYVTMTDGQHKGEFVFMEITMKAESGITAGQLYLITGDKSAFNNEQTYKFALMADGQYHTYTIPLPFISGYNGKIAGIRFDVDGADGASYTFKEIKLISADIDNLPTGISIARSFMTYSDKMHHVLQVSATEKTENIKEIGMLTEIREETVAKLIVKDKNGTHDSINGVDWASVEYIGFDIKNAGIFGYILPYDNNSGSLNVTLKNGVYVIEQTKAPEGGTIIPSLEGTVNANDFYMGQRIYTDDNHDFAEFLTEAEFERNPISSNYIKVDESASDEGKYLGYDALRGIYIFYYKCITAGPNDYPNVRFSIKGVGPDRKIYAMAYSDSTSVVECSILLNDKDFMLPVPIEVGKNFSEAAGERNLYNIDDPVYSESIFPLVIKEGEMKRYNMVNVYRKWGNFPVKQVSWIQFYAPYYHLSTGVTETNCITPYYATRISRNLSMLPDFRSMSAPPFSGDQKNSGGLHIFLQYTDAEGNYVTSESTKNTVGSFGPTYADVNMYYLSDDGKIKITYNHMEMPQEDENRTYYEMRYEILEDISFKDFAKDFSFYSVSSNDPKGVYTLLGYLDENNESKVVDAKMAGDGAVYYTLGKNAPYFSYMKMTDDRANKSGYVNLAFLVASSEFIIGGEKAEPNFVLADLGGTLSISLDYGEITLKKGDSITINSILMPWGSQETVYDGSNGLAPDQNVLDVRQNSIFDPLKATAKADCEVIDTVYVPMLKTTNGKSAEFTLSGGNDNCAVRIYGFDMLTVPKIYELIKGEWVPYRLASGYYSYNADTSRTFDGYGVYYDGDGTFSYSFIARIDNGEARTFKIVADQKFSSWQEIDKSDVVTDYIDPSSKYGVADNIFLFHVDFLNGTQNSFNSTAASIKEYDFSEETLSANKKLTIGGWTMVQGGVSKYLWSVDGKDWYDCSFMSSNKPGICGQSVINAANGMGLGYTFTETDAVGGNISGGNTLVIDLSEYAGQTVNVRIAAIPGGVEDKLSIFTVIKNVNVPVDSEEETTDNGNIEDEPLESEMKLVVGGEDLYNFTQTSQGAVTGISSIQYMDGYTRFYSDPDVGNGSFNVFTGNKAETGKYLVLKYRLPSNNPVAVSTLKFNVSTVSTGIAPTNLFYATAVFKSDDNWHLLVIDVEEFEELRTTTNEFLPNASDGKYYANFLKLYIFTDKTYGNGTYIDIEYVAMCNSFKTVKYCNKAMGNIHFTDKNSSSSPFYTNVTNEYRYLDPESSYTLADKYFCFHVDTINGSKNSYNSVSNKGITERDLNATIVTKLTIGGWCPVQGGTDKYMWSVDGKTWYECTASTNQSGSNVLSAASGQMSGDYTFTEADGVKGQYSITIDLSEYVGQTVDVRIGAIPADGEENTICVFTSINGVTVSAN